MITTWFAFSSTVATAQTIQWLRQFGTSGIDDAWDISADGLGNVYVTGGTEGDLSGTNAGEYDAFLRKYDSTGMLIWTEQLGNTSYDESRGVVADGLGNIYISGFTRGDLDGSNAG